MRTFKVRIRPSVQVRCISIDPEAHPSISLAASRQRSRASISGGGDLGSAAVWAAASRERTRASISDCGGLGSEAVTEPF